MAATPRDRQLPKPRTPAKRDGELLEVAAELFCRRGYAETSVRELADALGIRKASLYHYIDSKDDLLYRICRQVHEDSQHLFDRLENTDEPAIERLEAYIRGRVAFNVENLNRLAVY